MPFYATYTGHIQNGVFTTWDDCKKEIFKKPKYKKFDTLEEAQHFNTYGPFGTDETFEYCVYTDGSCRKSNKTTIGGYGIFFGKDDARNVSHRLEGVVTNNIAELTAVIECMKLIGSEKVGIYTDSQYAILCCTSYGEKCEKKKWPEDTPNLELVREGYTRLQERKNITLVHVTAHTLKCDVHSIGNREADLLAKNESNK
jgi:ribonuclease HI